MTTTEVRLHGRGGMGTVKAAEVLVYAAVMDGNYGNSIPFFGFERQGAPVSAFLRISREPIRPKNKVYHPQIVVVLESGIMKGVDVFAGMPEGGTIVLNTAGRTDFDFPATVKKAVLVDASALSARLIGRPLTNTVMLGAFVKATGLVSLEKTARRAAELWGEKNGECVRQGFEHAVMQAL